MREGRKKGLREGKKRNKREGKRDEGRKVGGRKEDGMPS